MSDLFYLSEDQFNRTQKYFPCPHGKPRVDDLLVISGIIHVLKSALQQRDAPREYVIPKTLYRDEIMELRDKAVERSALTTAMSKIREETSDNAVDF